jgi:hypothetical protein
MNMPMDQLFDLFQESDGTDAVRAILTRAEVPFHALRPSSLSAKVLGFSPRPRVNPSGKVTAMGAIADYCYPSYTKIEWCAAIWNERKEAMYRPPIDIVITVNTMYRLLSCLPHKYKPPFQWDKLSFLWEWNGTDEGWHARANWFYHQVPWQDFTANTNGLTFKMAHWDEPAPVGLAFCETSEETLIGVGAVGLAQLEFRGFLDNIVELHADDPVVDQLQAALRTTNKERLSS